LKKYLFVDLDDTLFSSLAKCASDAELQPAAYLKDRTAISFSTARQRAFFGMMDASMTLIPATARNHDAFNRVDLPFNDYKILNYGGLILKPDGEPDAYWREHMRAEMAAALPGLRQAMALIDAHADSIGLKTRARLIEDGGLAFYVVAKDPDKIGERLASFDTELLAPWVAGAGSDFYIHRNGNNLALLPNALNKARAVEYLTRLLREQHGEIMTMGMGDSRSDARFMAACDYAIIPNGTQLAALTVGAL
jgi:hydroxymethylpyrimidine pyrophosphatase-like HAD family hydrolase